LPPAAICWKHEKEAGSISALTLAVAAKQIRGAGKPIRVAPAGQ